MEGERDMHNASSISIHLSSLEIPFTPALFSVAVYVSPVTDLSRNTNNQKQMFSVRSPATLWWYSFSDLGHLTQLLVRGQVKVWSSQVKFLSWLLELKFESIRFSFPLRVQRYYFHLCQLSKTSKKCN